MSLAAHAGTLNLLVQYPWLLGSGLSHWLRKVEIAVRQAPARPDEDRLVAILGDPKKMLAPPAAVLKQLMYDWDAAGRSKGPPVRVRWGTDGARIADTAAKVARPVAGSQEPETRVPVPTGPEREPSVSAAEAGGGGAKVTVPLPPTSEPRRVPNKIAETPPNTAPAGVPGPARPETPAEASARTQAKPAAQVFQDEQQALRTEGSGLFDTKGFPLGDYANAVIERVKGNWFIPSNLRNSQGRTTVIFFIGRDGRSVDIHITSSSGSTSLDLAALNAVMVSNPFPPLPTGFPGDQVGAKFVFSYNERQ